jgi:hypothetical protein
MGKMHLGLRQVQGKVLRSGSDVKLGKSRWEKAVDAIEGLPNLRIDEF